GGVELLPTFLHRQRRSLLFLPLPLPPRPSLDAVRPPHVLPRQARPVRGPGVHEDVGRCGGDVGFVHSRLWDLGSRLWAGLGRGLAAVDVPPRAPPWYDGLRTRFARANSGPDRPCPPKAQSRTPKAQCNGVPSSPTCPAWQPCRASFRSASGSPRDRASWTIRSSLEWRRAIRRLR